MGIRVRGYLTFKPLIGDRQVKTGEEGTTLREVLFRLDSDIGESIGNLVSGLGEGSQSRPVIILVNGRQLPYGLETMLKDGDEVSIFPPMMGGGRKSGMVFPKKKIKIIATIGPASDSLELLKKMIANGMNIARVNFSHGNLESHSRVIANIRKAAYAMDQRVVIMGDLPGPKIRVGQIEGDSIQLQLGQPFILESGDFVGNSQRVSIDFPDLTDVVKKGDTIYLNDGYICLDVEKVEGKQVHTSVRSGGELRSRKGVNFPGIDLGIKAFTDEDAKFLKFASQQKIDAISQSFVQNAGDVRAVREAAKKINFDPFIIAKIERASALNNFEEILESTDGIMVARGDLGVEVPFQEIAIIQKEIIQKSNMKGKPVITATHMLESMIEHPRPNRAEVSDVANAIIDGSDCVMLSGETSVGKYPVESIAAMSSIASYTEGKIKCRQLVEEFRTSMVEGNLSHDDHISLSVYLVVEALAPRIIFAMTTTGSTARRLTRFRPPQWIVAISLSDKTCQELEFSYGVYPVFEPVRAEHWSCYVVDWMEKKGFEKGLALLTEGADTKKKRDTTLIEIIDLS